MFSHELFSAEDEDPVYSPVSPDADSSSDDDYDDVDNWHERSR